MYNTEKDKEVIGNGGYISVFVIDNGEMLEPKYLKINSLIKDNNKKEGGK